MRILIVLAVAVVVACGPSGKDMAGAKTAHYRGDQLVLFAAARSATEAKYKLATSDETTLRVVTEGRWYSPEGLGLTATMDNLGNVPDRSIFLSLALQLMAADAGFVIAVSPTILRYHEGRPNPDKLASDDPSLPGWVTGRVDQLQLAVHEALRSYEVKTVGGIVPNAEAR
ncbi:MAG: hypothetical protein WKG01_11765 [Kofleriaceae bacterium]